MTGFAHVDTSRSRYPWIRSPKHALQQRWQRWRALEIREVLTGFKPFKVSVIILIIVFPPTAQCYEIFSPFHVPERPMLSGITPKMSLKKHVCSQFKLVQWHERSRVTRTLPSFFRWEVALRFIWSIWCFVDGSVCWFRNPAKQLRLVVNIPLFTVRVA